MSINHDYTTKLLGALSHPEEQVRMGSIIALGKRKVPTTAVPLAQCAVNFPTQITQNIQIIECLKDFPHSHERSQALHLLCQHRSKPIAKQAKRVLQVDNCHSSMIATCS